MTWVAFDRAIRSAERFKLKAPLAEWREVRRQIHDDICRRAFHRRLGSFVQAYDSNEVDASLLLLPLVGFLPPDDPRVVATVRRIEKELIHKGFVMRYERGRGGSKPAHEGAFLPCSFWLADYYVLAGRRNHASVLLRRLLKVANDVGLLSEEFDVSRGSMLGNFPQALSHVALVNTIISLHTKHGPAHQRSGSRKGGKALL
jgi:GH15 family glucan-1,4-alpha-glucosidase